MTFLPLSWISLFQFLLCFHLYSRALIFVYFVKHGLKTRRLLDGSPYTNYCHVSFGYRYIDLPNNKFLESCKDTPYFYLLKKQTKTNNVCINFFKQIKIGVPMEEIRLIKYRVHFRRALESNTIIQFLRFVV